MGASDNQFEVLFQTQYDGAGAKAISGDLKSIKEEAGSAGAALREAGEHGGEGLGELSHGSREVYHGMHAAHFEMEALANFMKGDLEGAIHGATFAIRGLGGALGAGPLGIAFAAVAIAAGVWAKFSEGAEEANSGVGESAKKAEEWKTAFVDAATENLKELDKVETGLKRVRKAQDELGSARLALSLAEIDAKAEKGDITQEDASVQRAKAREKDKMEKMAREDAEAKQLKRAAQESIDKADADVEAAKKTAEKAEKSYHDKEAEPVDASNFISQFFADQARAKEVEQLKKKAEASQVSAADAEAADQAARERQLPKVEEADTTLAKNQIERQTTALTSQNSQAEAHNKAADAAQKERERIQKQFDQLQKEKDRVAAEEAREKERAAKERIPEDQERAQAHLVAGTVGGMKAASPEQTERIHAAAAQLEKMADTGSQEKLHESIEALVSMVGKMAGKNSGKVDQEFASKIAKQVKELESKMWHAEAKITALQSDVR